MLIQSISAKFVIFFWYFTDNINESYFVNFKKSMKHVRFFYLLGKGIVQDLVQFSCKILEDNNFQV